MCPKGPEYDFGSLGRDPGAPFECTSLRLDEIPKGSASTLLMGPAAPSCGGRALSCVWYPMLCQWSLPWCDSHRDRQEPLGYRRVGFSTKTRNSRVLPATRISKGVYGSVLRKHTLALRSSSPALGCVWGVGGHVHIRSNFD